MKKFKHIKQLFRNKNKINEKKKYHQLPADCLNEIFEYLEDKTDLRSCLLVNHLWCEVSVRILWRNIQNYDTLIACLSDESKEILNKNEIIIPTSTSKPPSFNYVSFIRNLSMYEIGKNIEHVLENHQPITCTFQNNDFKNSVITQEIFKMFMNQISLKRLVLWPYLDIPFTTYP